MNQKKVCHPSTMRGLWTDQLLEHVEELSEEDQTLKNDLEMLVTRLQVLKSHIRRSLLCMANIS